MRSWARWKVRDLLCLDHRVCVVEVLTGSHRDQCNPDYEGPCKSYAKYLKRRRMYFAKLMAIQKVV